MPWDDEEEQKPKGEKGEYCEICGAKGKWLNLQKCPMCHKYFCDQCQYLYGGKIFCSDFCAQEFFWGMDKEDE